MMTSRLQWFAIGASLILLIGLVDLVRKNRMALKYALLWLFSAVLMLILAIFPETLEKVSSFIGVFLPVNALFAILLCCGLMLMISFSVIVSGEHRAIVRLTQEVSLLEERVRQLESELAEAQETEEKEHDLSC